MTSDNIQGLETLEVWKMAKELALSVYWQVLPKLPEEEKWNLNNQIRRAALSVPANLAEGHGRYYFQENVRFCYIARGSLIELYSHLIVAHDLKCIPDGTFACLKSQIEDLTRMINGYISYLKRSKRGENEPGSHYSAREIPAGYSAGLPDFPDPLEDR